MTGQHRENSDPTIATHQFASVHRTNAWEHHEAVHKDLAAVAEAAGGAMWGEEHAVKSQDSLFTKVSHSEVIRSLASGSGDPFRAFAPAVFPASNQLISELNDVQRYTMGFPPNTAPVEGAVRGEYTDGVVSALQGLQARGYRFIEVDEPPDYQVSRFDLVDSAGMPTQCGALKNFWAVGNRYLGLNATLATPQGQVFELQFHTPESFHVKQEKTHNHYKTVTDTSRPFTERYEAMKECCEIGREWMPALPPGTEIFGAPKVKTPETFQAEYVKALRDIVAPEAGAPPQPGRPAERPIQPDRPRTQQGPGSPQL